VDRVDDVARAADIHLHGQFRVAIGKRRDHAADVKHLIDAGHGGKDIFVAGQVAPRPFKARSAIVATNDRMVLFFRPDQRANMKPVAALQQFGKRGATHVAGGTGKQDGLPTCHCEAPEI